ncbi:two-component regulator propeller domain-containing protein [Dysgonomonas sp. 25]|uniref:hybrid sensor histidine kinase/response regulator transcription factor n=1 Tax=Dysgonomonas sp. 25 TaxID=2302933 RepID=UPI0013D5EA10|nr:two-component regulator propeller domain-containing protein [Dysgonomonas sp. 25]NDV68538.1 response regulator [Dysgonomonas sp. 25]
MRNTYNWLLIIMLIHILSTHSASSQNSVSSECIFSSITVENGLSGNFIDDIFKDTHGFIWISTQGGGLCRFDGYECLQFDVNSSPIALKSNFIKKTCEDDYNRLWVASTSGIDVIDLKMMTQSDIASGKEFLARIADVSASFILKDTKGSIWILSTTELLKIDFDEKGSIENISSTNEADSKSSFSFTTISEIDGEMWVGSAGAIYHILPGKSGILVPVLVNDIPLRNPSVFISSILKKENHIWIGTEGALYRYNLTDKSFQVFLHDANDPASLSQNMITDLALTGDGTLVVGTLRGLNFYDPASNTFEHVCHGKDESSLNSDFVNCLLADDNTLWIGTEAGGVNKMSLRRLAIRNYIHDKNNPKSISPNPVNAILEDSKGNLWVGTVEGGLNLKLKGKDGFLHFTTATSSISHNSVSTLEEDASGNLWIGTWGKGINILPLNKIQQKAFEIHNDVGLDYIAVLKYDSINRGMWVGTNRNIFFFDDETHTMRQPLPESITKNIMGVLGCLIDEDDCMWLGTSKGLLQIDLHQFDRDTFTCPARYLTIEDKISELFFKTITSIYQTSKKDIWLGSNGYGICRLTKENGEYIFKAYTQNQGLVNNAAFGILEDEQGLLWIGTGYGLSCFDPETSHFVNYTKYDGLVNEQFYWNAGYKSPTNKNLYLGNMGGLSELKGNNQYLFPKREKVTFTKLQVLNKTVWSNEKYLETDIVYADHIDLHERDKSFSIEFSAMDYDNPSTVVYSYRLLGFEDDWVDVQADRRFVSYTNLKPGAYTLQVRSMSGNHDWTDNISEIDITVHPFFYKTGWFIALCVLFIFIGIVSFYRWRVQSFKKQREILHKKVEERTQVLKEQKALLEDQAMELKFQNEMLVSQNEKILSQQKQLIDMSKKVQEATSDKISFFTNITHEFRTPITLIIGPIERALKLSTNQKVIEQLQYVARNSKHLLSLVNQLMDFRKVESGNMPFNPVTGNLINFLNEILYPFESYANERNIVIRKFYRLIHPYVLYDEEAIRKVVTNLMSNAIKFTPDNGVVSIYLTSLADKNNNTETLYLCIQDTGIGIREEDRSRIFNRFYQSKDNEQYPISGQSGTGIGLYLSKKIITIQGGSIEAKNNHVKGASIRVLLPLFREKSVTSTEIDATMDDKAIDMENDPLKNILGEQKLHILVVEDNHDMRKYIRSILSDYYKVLEASNGEEALDIIKSKNIDFIISDLMMPVMDGLELSKKVKSDYTISHIPFLMLTAKTNVETRICSFKTGVDEFISKPFDEELLLTRINNILESRRAYQRRFSLKMDVNELNIAEESIDDRFLRKAIEIVKENYRNPEYEVSDFIDAIGMSKSVTNRKMHTLAGQSPGNFIRNYRLSVAYELLQNSKGNMSISEIAYEVGFNDPKYFTRCFTKHFGTAPSEINRKE